jgi:hypothetical protein
VSPRLIYLHGFASGQRSQKAVLFREYFSRMGFELDVPDLNPPDFRDLTVGAMVHQVEDILAASSRPASLIGSSLGGYIASLVASRTEAVHSLVLLAPAFDLRARWTSRLGPEGLRAWKRLGSVSIYHHAFGENRPLAYRFYEESEGYPAYPDISRIPVLAFHGRHDEVIPPGPMQTFSQGHDNVDLRIVDDTHELIETAPIIVEEAFRFLERTLLTGDGVGYCCKSP